MRNKFGYRHERKRARLSENKYARKNNRKETRGRDRLQRVFNKFLGKMVTIIHSRANVTI